jgi:hypothetical protein
MDEEHDHTDLGVSSKEEFGGSLGMMSVAPEGSGAKHYPSFHYSGPEELELPDEGKMEICFSKTSETSRVLPSGKRWYECTIEVKCFGDVEDCGDGGENNDGGDDGPGTDAEKALDTLARALGKEKEQDG